MSNRETFRAAARRRRTNVINIPEVGELTLRGMLAGEATTFWETMKDNPDANWQIILSLAMDSDGKPMFESIDDVKEMSVEVAHTIATAIRKFIDPDLEKIEKNSEASQT